MYCGLKHTSKLLDFLGTSLAQVLNACRNIEKHVRLRFTAWLIIWLHCTLWQQVDFVSSIRPFIAIFLITGCQIIHSICKAWNCINQCERPFAFLYRFAANNHCHLLKSLKDCRPNVIYIFNIYIQVHIRSDINSSITTMLILEESTAGNPLCHNWYEHQNQTAQVWTKFWHFCILVLKMIV